MANPTLASLLVAQTQEDLFQIALGVYQANGFPVQSWQPLGVERTRLMAFTKALADALASYVPAYVGAGFLDYATGAWLQLTAQELYNILYNAATFTQGSIVLTAASGVGSATYQAGELIAIFDASQRRYSNLSSVVVPTGPGTVTATFQAEFAGAAYNNDPSNSGDITLVTPIPGVSLTNPASTYTSVAHVGSGTGSITPSGSPTEPHQTVITFTSTGASGIASWEYSIDGAPAVSAGAVASATNIGGTSINITLADGASGTSFVDGDTYTFNNPGSWITQQGSDVESDASLATRCRNRWASLSVVPTQGLYELLATSTPSVGSQVTQVIVLPDTVINNKVNIIVAGPAGILPPATVAAIQTYINPRARGTDNPVVASPSSLNVTLAGTITCTASALTTVQAGVQDAVSNYVNSVGINGTIRIAAIIDAIMNLTGAVDATGITINGVAANLVLGSSTTFVLASLQPLGFSYSTVPG